MIVFKPLKQYQRAGHSGPLQGFIRLIGDQVLLCEKTQVGKTQGQHKIDQHVQPTQPVHSGCAVQLRKDGEDKADRVTGQVGIGQSLLRLLIAEVPAEPVEHPKTE